MDLTLTITVIGFATLITERFFAWMMKMKKSSCCLGSIEMDVPETKQLINK